MTRTEKSILINRLQTMLDALDDAHHERDDHLFDMVLRRVRDLLREVKPRG